MRYSIIAAAAFSALVSASSTANPFSNPSGGYVFTAGDATTLTWDPTTSGTVSLRLQWGSVTTAESGDAIASDIDNSGSYTWDVPTDLVKGREYTIEILDDSDSSDYNFLPYFTVAGATATASATATSTSSSASTTSEATSTSSASSSTTSSTSSSSSSTSTSSTSTKSAATTMSTVTSTSASTKSTASTASSTSSSSSSSSGSASSTASQTSVPTNAAGMTRVSAGMLAVVAGAAALL
ncbi:Ser-Thr-rich glycosyl-phosphatidyl-inositol-anchored membrane family-domain-containing protein [Penicillium pulvis]|uniref:Ser-Thr-rich glycosyl-phosphatidyl-inositol-anchored membrane family-domain-containing protein n=1 Tax=Penicillium pulvis TaxID=1562058 RepID=UPI0025484CCF|nr:Ser-Thr-rich glycosyl-phosphatidyl-inositol-anchored membrane family-domain-containing protein [Penicillium pulvis]KAJ5806203.1 Ser-Thr-rich glycosyl-phosphatidyl-inositol-anchored membrane family-domain-containing protein [Penicillium pulvis]